MSDNDGRGFVVLRPGVPATVPYEVGQLVATFPVLDHLAPQADYRDHDHAHPLDVLGPVAAAEMNRSMAENAERYGVADMWADDPQAVDAAMILTWAKDRTHPCREIKRDRLRCPCRHGNQRGVTTLLRSFVVDGRKWLVTSGFKIGNDEKGRVRVPPLAEPLPGNGAVHVQNLLAVCEHCMQGIFVQPLQEGRVQITRLGAPTFGTIAA